MSIRNLLDRHGRHVGTTLNALFSIAITCVMLVYFNSNSRPSEHARLGTVVVDLGRLGFRMSIADLQSVGLFGTVNCRKCDFPKGGKTRYVEDFENPRFMGTLTRYGSQLYLNFYSEDVAAGQARLKESLQALRAKFPGSADAINVSAWGYSPAEQDVR